MTEHRSTEPLPMATIARDGRLVRFEPVLPDILEVLCTSHIASSNDPSGRCQIDRPRIFRVDEPGSRTLPGVTRPGLLLVLSRMYARLGLAIRCPDCDVPPAELGPFDLSWTDGRPAVDRAVIDFVRRNREGLIHYSPNRIDVAWFITQLALAFPKARQIAVIDSKDEGLHVARRLRPHLGYVPAVNARSYLDDEPRVAVSTLTGLAELEVEKADVIVFLRTRDVVLQRAEDPLGVAHAARIFGFVPFGMQPSPFEKDLVRSVFGFAEISVPAHGKVVRPVAVLQCDLWGGPRREVPTVVDVLREFVWRDPVRSRRVAKLAKLITRGDMNTMRTEFPRVADVVSPRSMSNQCVVVICENVEHLMYQARWLPNWLRVPHVDQTRSNESAPAESASRWPDHSFGVVVTRDALASGQLDISGVDVAIYAGASPHPPVIPVELLAADPANAGSLLLIDFRDRRHPDLRCWSRERAERYEGNEWFEPGIDPVEARVDRFIDMRRSS